MKKIKIMLFKFFPKTMNGLYFRKVFGKKLDLKHPKMYSEKLQYLKFYYANDDKVILAGDKVGIHTYLKTKSLDKLLVPAIGVFDSVDEIEWSDLPSQFVIKKSNSSGMNIVVNDKEQANREKILKQMDLWMKETFGVFGAEKHYSKMKSKILIEKYIEGIEKDWKIFFLNGEPKMIQVNHWVGEESINYSGHRETIRTFTDIDGKIESILADKDVENVLFSEGDYIPLPKDIIEMLDSGRRIAVDFPFVRVDYFYAAGQLYLGELTFTPGSGFEILNEELQDKLGKLLQLPKED